MHKLVRNSLAVVLFAGTAVPVGYSAAQAGTTETGCHDIEAGGRPAFNAAIKSASVGNDPLIGDAEVHEEYYPDAGVVQVDMPLAAPSCESASYSFVVRSTRVDGKGKRQVFRELTRRGDGVSSTLRFEGFIDSYTGYTDAAEQRCVEAFMVVKDAAGRVIDVSPNEGEPPVDFCQNIGGGQVYGG